MKKIGSILLSIILGICALFTLLLSIVRVDLSYSALTKIAGEILKPVAKLEVPADGLFHPEDKIISLAQYDEYGDFDFSSEVLCKAGDVKSFHIVFDKLVE